MFHTTVNVNQVTVPVSHLKTSKKHRIRWNQRTSTFIVCFVVATLIIHFYRLIGVEKHTQPNTGSQLFFDDEKWDWNVEKLFRRRLVEAKLNQKRDKLQG